VPSDKYADVLEQLTRQVGTKLSLQQEAEDVTEQVADVNSRVKSAQATLQTFRKLLDRAQSLGEILNVEQEITKRESDLESLQARQKSLAQQTRYATVTLQLETPSEQPKAPTPADKGFTGGLKAGWHVFLVVLSVAAVGLGWSLPFLVVAVVIGLPVWKLRKARRKRATPDTPPRQPTPMPPYPTNPR
jgi:Flp pilus assembly protein TadB